MDVNQDICSENVYQLQRVVENDDFLDVSSNDDTSSVVIRYAFFHKIQSILI